MGKKRQKLKEEKDRCRHKAVGLLDCQLLNVLLFHLELRLLVVAGASDLQRPTKDKFRVCAHTVLKQWTVHT